MTRADWIRAMNDEELAKFIVDWHAYYAIPCDYVDRDGNIRYGTGKFCGPVGSSRCMECTMEWLMEAADPQCEERI